VKAVFFVLATLFVVSQAALELDDASFKAEVLESGKSAFVKFLAPW
jgi:hypothetical protein